MLAELARRRVRTTLTEAAWSYRQAPTIDAGLRRRQADADPDLTRAIRLVTCFEPLEDVAGGVGEVGVEGEALAVDLDGR